MEFKQVLRELRTEKGVTQQQLGKVLCVSKMAVSHWEQGDSEPGISQLKALAAYFEVSVDFLLGCREDSDYL